jgi:tetratricopeptide (TPR) repeat protein
MAYYSAGVLCLRRGAFDKALSRLGHAVSICQDVDLPVYFPDAASALGAASTLVGQTTEALALLERAVEQGSTIRRMDSQALRVAYLGEAHLLAGHLEEAHTLAQHALDLSCTYQERGREAYTLRLLGDILAHHESLDAESAEAYYHQALALAEELGMRPLQAHSHRGLGRLYLQAGQSEQARAALSTAIEMYRSMDMAFWLPETEATLAEVEKR